ncbi:phage T7 F exclusion suppressor FxsA [Amantichitinum ursilacus]|uniref:Phage T7 F exclusion suppressor FxsA n=1 Tax=Amantichitinum ursilacus TaxID=857265 RepID=A0A0N1JS44_9NEIS|nr:phage T7 F exclusion suppressor FxsA [Amantichitinum ursilacus]
MLEIVVMIMVAHAFGVGVLLAWLVVAAIVGGLMLRHHKMAVAWSLFDDLRAGRVKTSSLFWVARYYISAVLLLLPGIIGDVVALIMLLPWPGGGRSNGGNGPGPRVPEGVIEGDYRRIDPKVGPDRQLGD